MTPCGETYLGKVAGQTAAKYADLATNYAMKKIRTWTGFGDYKISYNSLIEDGSPVRIDTVGGDLVITYKEYLGDVTTSPTTVGGFNVVQYKIQPGDQRSFPFLAPIANQYDQWIPQGIIYEFKSTASDLASNASLGSVIMMTDYDLNDDPPDNKSIMLNTAYSQEARMSADAFHGVESDPTLRSREVLFTRPYGMDPNDREDYDLGYFYIATQGGSLPVATAIGSLYVHYQIRFTKAAPTGGWLARTNTWQEVYMQNNGLSTKSWWGDLPVTNCLGSYTNICFKNGSGAIRNRLTFPIEYQNTFWELRVDWSGASATIPTPADPCPSSGVTHFLNPFGSNYQWCIWQSGAGRTDYNRCIRFQIQPNILTEAYVDLSSWVPSPNFGLTDKIQVRLRMLDQNMLTYQARTPPYWATPI